MKYNINYNLVTQYPIIARNWNYEKNAGLSPFNFAPKSCKKVWWKCSKCHYEWKTNIYSRTAKNTGCPNCYLKSRTKSSKKCKYN